LKIPRPIKERYNNFLQLKIITYQTRYLFSAKFGCALFAPMMPSGIVGTKEQLTMLVLCKFERLDDNQQQQLSHT
jgi:hypothetical protein